MWKCSHVRVRVKQEKFSQARREIVICYEYQLRQRSTGSTKRRVAQDRIKGNDIENCF